MATSGSTSTSYSPISLLTGTTLLAPKTTTTTTTSTAPKTTTTMSQPTQGGGYTTTTTKPSTPMSQPTQGGGYGSGISYGSSSTSGGTTTPRTSTAASQPTQGGGYTSSSSATTAPKTTTTTKSASQPTQGGGIASAATSGSTPRSSASADPATKQAMNSIAGIDRAAQNMPQQTKQQIAAAFQQALAAAAHTGAAVPNPAGLTSAEADKYRSQFYSQFYGSQPVQQIVDNSALPMPSPAQFSAMFPGLTPSFPQAPLPDLTSPLYQVGVNTGAGVTPTLVNMGGGNMAVQPGFNTPYMGEEFGGYAPSSFGMYPIGFNTGAADTRGLAAAMSPRPVTPATIPYGQGTNTVGMPNLQYVAPGNQIITPDPTQAVRPGVPAGMPAAPFIPQAVRPGTPAGLPAALPPAAPAGGGYDTDMLNSKGIARYLLQDMMGKQQSAAPTITAQQQPSQGFIFDLLGLKNPGITVVDKIAADAQAREAAQSSFASDEALKRLAALQTTAAQQQQASGFDLMNLLIGQARGDEYKPGAPIDPSKVAPIPYNYPRPTQVGTTVMPLSEIRDTLNKKTWFGIGIPSNEDLGQQLQAGAASLGGSYDPKSGLLTIPNAKGPEAEAAKYALLNPTFDPKTMSKDEYNAALLRKELLEPYIKAAQYENVPPVPNTRPVPPDLTRPIQTLDAIMGGATSPTRAAITVEPASIPTKSVTTVKVGPDGQPIIMSPTEAAVAGFGGPDLGTPNSPLYYSPPDLTAPAVVRDIAPIPVQNRMSMTVPDTLAMYNALGQQGQLGGGFESRLATTIYPEVAAALAQNPQITSAMTQTNPPGPAGTTARGQPLFPSIGEPMRGTADQIVGKTPKAAPIDITVAGGKVTNDAGMYGRGLPSTGAPKIVTGAPDLGAPLYPGEGEEPIVSTGDGRSSYPGFEEQVTSAAGANRTPTGAKRFTPEAGQTVGTNGYIYERQADGTYKNVGKVPGYTDAQLYKAANAGAFRDPNNIPQGGTTPKPPSALRTWARDQLKKYNAEVAKKKAAAEAKGEKYDPISFMDYLQLAGSAASGNVAGLLLKGGQMVYPQILEWLANGPSGGTLSEDTEPPDLSSPISGNTGTTYSSSGSTGSGRTSGSSNGDTTGGTGGTGTGGGVTPAGGTPATGYGMKNFNYLLPYLTPIFPSSAYRPGVDPEWNYYPGSERAYAQGGAVNPPRLVRGPGGPKSDSIPARIDGVHEARLSDGEFVITADAVKGIGGGDMQRGAEALMQLNDMFASRSDRGRLNVEKVR